MSADNNILVVDDSPPVITMIKKILKGYNLKEARSGEEALEIIPVFKPDLILLDVTMHGIDGFEVCRRVRSDGGYNTVKIIMVSSGTILKERIKGYEAGADDYICKPFNKDEFQAKVRAFLRLKQVEDQLQELNATLNEQVQVRTQQLLDAEKMAEIGRYAAGIVHNLKNPLQIIMGEAELIARNDPSNESIGALKNAASHMKEIIGTILTTSHRKNKEFTAEIDLNQVIKDQINLLQANQFFKYEVQTRLELSVIPPYPGIYAHFSQIFGNLIHNAVEAMYDSPEKILTIRSAEEKDAVLIRIRDTGYGIPVDKQETIFDAFYTTKPLTAKDGRPTGTGLGLASSKEMAASYGGDIFVDSKVSEGTEFTLRLPFPGPAQSS